jgi:hypothetical protein
MRKKIISTLFSIAVGAAAPLAPAFASQQPTNQPDLVTQIGERQLQSGANYLDTTIGQNRDNLKAGVDNGLNQASLAGQLAQPLVDKTFQQFDSLYQQQKNSLMADLQTKLAPVFGQIGGALGGILNGIFGGGGVNTQGDPLQARGQIDRSADAGGQMVRSIATQAPNADTQTIVATALTNLRNLSLQATTAVMGEVNKLLKQRIATDPTNANATDAHKAQIALSQAQAQAVLERAGQAQAYADSDTVRLSTQASGAEAQKSADSTLDRLDSMAIQLGTLNQTIAVGVNTQIEHKQLLAANLQQTAADAQERTISRDAESRQTLEAQRRRLVNQQIIQGMVTRK